MWANLKFGTHVRHILFLVINLCRLNIKYASDPCYFSLVKFKLVSRFNVPPMPSHGDIGWLAHLASHSPLNPRVNNAVGSNPTC